MRRCRAGLDSLPEVVGPCSRNGRLTLWVFLGAGVTEGYGVQWRLSICLACKTFNAVYPKEPNERRMPGRQETKSLKPNIRPGRKLSGVYRGFSALRTIACPLLLLTSLLGRYKQRHPYRTGSDDNDNNDRLA